MKKRKGVIQIMKKIVDSEYMSYVSENNSENNLNIIPPPSICFIRSQMSKPSFSYNTKPVTMTAKITNSTPTKKIDFVKSGILI